MNTIEQAREVSARIWVAGYLDESATIDALIADRNEWRDEALSAQERFKAAEDKLAALRGQEPVEFRQFLSDVVTAAGLVEYGKKSKVLAERLSEGAFRYMAAAPAQAQERKPLTDEQITEVWRELRAQKEDWSDLDFARAIEAKIKEQP